MAKTLETTQEEYLTTHYLCKCEHCEHQIVVAQTDFENFFSVPEHAEHESAWKCPVCGHVNIENTNNDIFTKCCHQNGSQNLMFELTEKETEYATAFIAEHSHKDEFKKENKLQFSTLGQQFTYEITPGGLGNCVTIKCNYCGAKKEITDFYNW